MRLALILLAHHRPEQLALLLGQLRHAHVRVYLHLDRRVSLRPFRQAMAGSRIGEITMLPRHRSRWGGIGAVDAAVDGLKWGLADRCDYFVLLSGQDFPLWPVDDVAGFFADNRERSYMEHFPLPDGRWALDGRMRTDFYTYDLLGRRETCIPRGEDVALSRRGRLLNALLRTWTAHKPPRKFPAYTCPFGGSAWWNLSRAAAEWVVRFLAEHPDYRAYHLHTLSPDELYFQSALVGRSFPEEHEVVNESLRFSVWQPGESHPRLLSSADVPAMLGSRKPFARKFDVEFDRSVFARLREERSTHLAA